jgi:hypothetical protein
MTTETPVQDRTEHRETMNRAMGLGVFGVLAATVAAVFAPDRVDDLFLFAGVGLYYLGVVGYLFVWQRTGVRLFDEREAAIERRTGQVLALIVMFVTVFGVPADVLLDVTGAVEVPPAVRGAIWGYALLSLLGLFVYGYVERQHS